MKPLAVLLFLVAGSMMCGQDKAEDGRQIMLPSPSLLSCGSVQLWESEKAGGAAVYPVWVHLDNFDDNGCPRGMMAVYDKTVSLNNVRAALDRRYDKWAVVRSDTGKVYRVEPEKVAIQLSKIEADSKTMRAMGEKGMTLVIYLSFSLGQRTGATSSSKP
jgi:hypothetical protein